MDASFNFDDRDKKKRAKAFNEKEKWTLVEMFEKKKDILLNRDGKAEVAKRKNSAWKEVHFSVFNHYFVK